MNHHRKTNHRKSSSSSSSENSLRLHIEQPLSATSHSSSSRSSTKKTIYPNVPKRTSRPSSITEHDEIQTESRIEIISSEIQTQKPDEYSSTISSSNQNAHTRHNLDLITKYTSPQKLFQPQHRPLSPIQSRVSLISNSQPTYRSKAKRALSPFDETNQQIHESKRPKSFDEDDDDDDDNELSQFLDHRRTKQYSSQHNNTTMSSQTTNDSKQRKATARKPTARKLNTSQQQPIIPLPSPIENIPIEPLIIEPDIDTEEENTNDHEQPNWIAKCSQISNTEHNGHTESEDHFNQSNSILIFPSPIKLPLTTCNDTSNPKLKQNIPFTPVKSYTSLNSILRKTLENLPDNFSPCSTLGGRRFSSTSSNSLIFDTPRSSLSRTTTSNTLSSSQTIIKTDHQTQISYPSNNDMMGQLIFNMHFNVNSNINKIIYDPTELGKSLFAFSSTYNYQSVKSLLKKQVLNFGRYEIEVPFPMDIDKMSTIYVCDLCLKHFHGSSMAFQRHTAKCLSTQPPGKLVFNENDLSIFEIGETKMNNEQRIYIKFLCRIARLFIDSNKSIDDTKLGRFSYYILCRRDPILSPFQPSLYRFVGYFSKKFNQTTQQLINNLSCLFILPPFAQHQEYNQCLIAFSYSLIRSNTPTNLTYSSPARPLDNKTLTTFRRYWCDVIYDYINQHSIQTVALDTLARQTSIHPRDILSTLYINGFVVPHSIDKSSVYLLKNAYHSMTSLKLYIRNKLLFMDMIDTDNERIILTDKQNSDKNRPKEIVLD